MNPPCFAWPVIALLLACLPGSCRAQTHTQASDPEVWHLALVGDVMLGSDYPTPDVPANHGAGLLDAAAPFLRHADLAMGNLEGAFAQAGTTGKSACRRCFAFRMPPALAPRLKEAGFTLWNSANNHANDFGDPGQVQTRRTLSAWGMESTGSARLPEARATVRGRHACLLGFAPNRGMNDLRDIGRAQEIVRTTKASCDLLVVAFHGGAEGSDRSHTPLGVETYLGENRGDVRRFSHAVIDAGADVVFGQGPHTARGLEVYREKLIAYSLGNFMTYGRISVSGTLGLAPLVEVSVDGHGRLVSGAIHAFRQVQRRPLQSDSSRAVVLLMERRTLEDFGGGGLRFDAQGRFWPATASPTALVSRR